MTVDGFTVEAEVGDGDGVFELGQGGDSRIGENAVIKNNVINADPQADTRMQGILYESNPDTGSGDEADDDELFIENNLLEQKDGERVDAVNSNESDIDTLVITDNTFNIGLITLSDGELATITDNEFTEEAPLGVAFFGGGADIEENSFETQGIWTLGDAAVNVHDNDFNADEDTDYYVRDSTETLDLDGILNEQGNTFDPDGSVGTFDEDDAIVPNGD